MRWPRSGAPGPHEYDSAAELIGRCSRGPRGRGAPIAPAAATSLTPRQALRTRATRPARRHRLARVRRIHLKFIPSALPSPGPLLLSGNPKPARASSRTPRGGALSSAGAVRWSVEVGRRLYGSTPRPLSRPISGALRRPGKRRRGEVALEVKRQARAASKGRDTQARRHKGRAVGLRSICRCD